MNIYQQSFKEDFIKELPVDFHRVKVMDLSTIPEIYRVLFTTDWNWGIHSKMRIEDRMFCEGLFNEYNRWDVNQRLLSKEINQPEDQVQGFVKD